MAFFNLAEGEKIVKEIKPLPALKWYIFVHALIFFIFVGFFVSFFLAITIGPLILLTLTVLLTVLFGSLHFSIGVTYLVVTLLLGFAISFGGSYAYAWLEYDKRNYWITNKRILYKRGILGYTITSIPMERISDTIVSRTFLESLFGFGSLRIQSLAGQVSPGMRGAEAHLEAVPDPEELQKLVTKLVREKRAEEKLHF